MSRSPTIIRLLGCAVLLSGLVACDKSAPPGPAGSTAAAGAAGAPASAASVADAEAAAALAATEPPLPDLGDFRVVTVLMGDAVDGENVVLVDTREFDAKDPIYASVLSIGAHQGLQLSADWLAPDGNSFARTVQPVVPSTDLATTFKVKHPDTWPPGEYQLRIAINGHTVRSEKFRVR